RPLYKYAKERYRDDYKEYYVIDVNKLKDKFIFEFSFSNNGHLSIRKYDINDFNEKGELDKSKGEEIDLKEASKELCDKFELSHNAKIEYEEFKAKYFPMIREIKEYINKMRVEILAWGHSIRFEEVYLYECPIGCLAEYRGATRCLCNVKRWIYQLWIMKLIFEAIDTEKFL
ncbi:MAG: hypothetical protein ACP5GJ_04640, partial [Nanopusillaceae archaeon]